MQDRMQKYRSAAAESFAAGAKPAQSYRHRSAAYQRLVEFPYGTRF